MAMWRASIVLFLCVAVGARRTVPRASLPPECHIFVDKTEDEVAIFVGHWAELLFGPSPSISLAGLDNMGGHPSDAGDAFKLAMLSWVDRERLAKTISDPTLRQRFVAALDGRFRASTSLHDLASTDYGPEEMLADALRDVPEIREAIPILPWKVRVVSNVWYNCSDDLKQTVYRITEAGTWGRNADKHITRILSTDADLIAQCTIQTDWRFNTCQRDANRAENYSFWHKVGDVIKRAIY